MLKVSFVVRGLEAYTGSAPLRLLAAIRAHLTAGTERGVNYCPCLFYDCGAICTMWDISQR
jgi:hypothetical protein